MSLYEDKILPHCINYFMKGELFSKLRKESLSQVSGKIFEIGFGTGLNLPYYPDDITSLTGLDPATLGRKIAAKRLEQAPFEVGFAELFEDGTYEAESNSYDWVVSTWTLCTVPDTDICLKEIRRILKPGGKFLFLEHGISEEANIIKWQNRLNPIQKKIGGGCNLNRSIDKIIENAGFKVTKLKKFYVKAPKVVGFMYQGVAEN